MDRESLPIRDAVAWALFAAAVATVFALATYPNVPPSSDVWDYSQEARQMARGEGFTSLYTYPVHLSPHDSPPFPVRWRMPLYAAMGAALLKLGVPLPAGYFAIGIASQALLVGLLFLLTAHLHSARAGAIAAAAALACPLLLDPYSAALSQLPAAALALGAWLLLSRGSGILSACGAALLAGAAWYLRGESLLMVPVWIWAASSGGRLRRGAAFAIFYTVVCVPWLIVLRASVGAAAPIQGNPMLLYTAQYPGYSSARTYGEAMPGMLEYALHHPVALLWRFVKDAAGYCVDVLWGLGPIAVGLGMTGLLLREADARWRSLKPALPLLIAAAIQVAAFSLLERSPRFLVPAMPLLCAALGVAAAPSLDRFCGRRMVVAIFAVLLLERAATLAFETREAARRFPPLPTTFALEVEKLIQNQPRSALIWTDVPDWIAWHLDRPALLLPLGRQRGRVAAEHPPVVAFLSPNARGRNLADGDLDWERGGTIPNWMGPGLLGDGGRVYYFHPEEPRSRLPVGPPE